jgi:RNA polymerase sigma-70 factor (ECF subfamily)
MELSQSVNQSSDLSFMPRSTSSEPCADFEQLNPHVQRSLISNEVLPFSQLPIECVPPKPGASAIEAVRNSTMEQQNHLEVRSLDKSIADYSQTSDEQLLAGARAFDERAFQELSRRCQASLRNRVFRIVRNREDTEDVMQETLLKAYTHLKGFQGTCRFSTWLTRIAINSALMALRKRKSRSEVPHDQQGNEEQKWEVWEFPDPSPNPEQACRKHQVIESVSLAVSRLPLAQRSLFELHHVHEHSVQECADAVGITVAAAKARLLRARLTIRTVLAKSRLCSTDACC